MRDGLPGLRLREAEVPLGLSVPVAVALADHEALPLPLPLGLPLPEAEALGEGLREGVGVHDAVALGDWVRRPDGVCVAVTERVRLPAGEGGGTVAGVGGCVGSGRPANIQLTPQPKCNPTARCRGCTGLGTPTGGWAGHQQMGQRGRGTHVAGEGGWGMGG